MDSGILSLQSLLTYVSCDDPVGASLHGISPAGRTYSKFIRELTAPVSEERGVYVWGRYEPDGVWVHIYVGKTEKGKTSSLRARLKEELSNERCVLWRSVIEEEQLFSLGEQYYPSMWPKYGKEWRRFLLKSGSTHIVWVTTPELANEQIPSAEVGLIRLLNPSANIARPRTHAAPQPIVDEIASHINRRVNEHRVVHSGSRLFFDKLPINTEREIGEQQVVPSEEVMTIFSLIGTVPDYSGTEFIMPADNEDEFRDWLTANRIDTFISLVQGRLGVKIRGNHAAKCRPGSRIRYTIQAVGLRDGRRIHGVKVEPYF